MDNEIGRGTAMASNYVIVAVEAHPDAHRLVREWGNPLPHRGRSEEKEDDKDYTEQSAQESAE